MKFRKLTAEEIDLRVSTVNEKGCSLLLFKDARVDQNILDETFGMFNWQRSHQLIGDRLYCTVSVKDPDTGEWISKQDVGTESFTEPEKGQASDSFKRACFNFGIGRELYTAPFIWVPAEKCTVKAGKNGKPAVYDRFRVKEIGYAENGTINRLVIINSSKKEMTVFTMGKAEKKDPEINTDPGDRINEAKVRVLRDVLKKHDMPDTIILLRYNRQSIEELTTADWNDFTKAGAEILKKWDEEHAA